MIKYGGAAMTDPELREDFARDVVLLKYVGLNPIVVHGGGPDITAYMKRLDMPVEFVGGLRVSDADTVEIAKMVLVGKVNKDIVLRINRHGQPAVGLSRRRRPAVPRVDDGRARAARTSASSGRIERVDVGVIEHIADDYIPVIASVGADRDGPLAQRQRRRGGGRVARALGAYKVMFLTDVRGWLRDPADPASVISEAAPTRSRRRCRRSQGGMRPKLQACLDAIHGGVTFAHIIDGRRAALAAARAVHRRRHRHEGEARVDEPLAAHLRALPRRVRLAARACVLRRRRGQRVPRLPGRDRGLQRRPLPSGAWSRRSRSRSARLIHVSNLFYTEPNVRLAERLAERSLGGKVFFCNSGAEANEAAIKLVRKARPRGDVVVAHGAFHGRTYGALSRDAAGVQAGAVRAAGAGLPRGRMPARVAGARSTSDTAAVLIEPIQGESGVHVDRRRAAGAPIRAACDAVGAALVFDEVQTGMGRTGTLWAYEQTRRRARRDDARQGPRRRAADRRAGHRRRSSPTCSRPATTARRSPAARWSRAAANAALDVIDDEAFLARVRERGERLREGSASCRACSRCAGAG